MKEKTEEEFREFVLDNEEKISEILRAGRSKADSKLSKEVEKGKAFTKGVLEAFMSKDVQEHFIRMGVEMMMGIGALIRALPLPDEFGPVVDAVAEQNEALGEMVSKSSSRKPRKKKSSLEKIEVK